MKLELCKFYISEATQLLCHKTRASYLCVSFSFTEILTVKKADCQTKSKSKRIRL